MAYHGYIPFVKQFISRLKHPRILEVGLDKGITTIPLLSFMSPRYESYEFVGVDVFLREELKLTIAYLDRMQTHSIDLIQENSLTFLPKLVVAERKFDVILLDGDHNYYTVQKEISCIDSLLDERGIIIVDDYHGRWSEKDMWYAEKDEYASNSDVTKRVNTEKQGVKCAVDEFLSSHPSWQLTVLLQGEPVILSRII